MGDFIKGNKFLLFPEKIKQGILLHRKIDSFTDSHPLIYEAISFFKPSFRLSGGVFVDILFDHFLANDHRYFNESQLQTFTSAVYLNLKNNEIHFNEQMQQLFSHMATYNWLFNYRNEEGLHRSITGICKRHPVLGDSQQALHLITQNYPFLQKLYLDFFPELEKYVSENQ